MSDYWFFLSYARRNDVSSTLGAEGDKTQKLVRRLYEDLAAEIISGADTGQAKTPEQIGFFDQIGIAPGDKWHVPVAEALRTTRVMLCLFTRNYFSSRVSGQEFDIFRRRVAGYATKAGIAAPPLIFPILWHGPDRLPTPLPNAVSDLQYTYDEFSKAYAGEGLEYIMRLEKHKDDYQEFLIKLAKRIVKIAEAHKLLPLAQPPSLDEAKNAFVEEPAVAAQQAAVAGTPALAHAGPGFAHFVFVAGQKGELKRIRNEAAPYDSDGRLWRPYVPNVDRPVALFTQKAATDVDLQHEVLPVSKHLLQQLEAADDSNTIVILVVDPWTLHVQEYYEQMKAYDKRNLVSCAALIVWNDDDRDGALTPEQLQRRVQETFGNSFTNQNLYVRNTIRSDKDLGAELLAAIVEIRRRLDVRAKIFRPIDDAGYAALPQLVAPSGTRP